MAALADWAPDCPSVQRTSQARRDKPRVRNQFFRGGLFLPLNKFRPELILGGSKFNVTHLSKQHLPLGMQY